MFERISHIGIIVKDMDAALAIWQDKFGLKKFSEANIEVEGIRSVFLSVSGKPGEMTIELMEPTDQSDMSNPVARRLANNGEGFYHVAVVVDGVEKSTQDMKDLGFPVIERGEVEQDGEGRWLIHPKATSGVMVEGIPEWDGTTT
jgi:methylmalonyl-CoA epimerase